MMIFLIVLPVMNGRIFSDAFAAARHCPEIRGNGGVSYFMFFQLTRYNPASCVCKNSLFLKESVSCLRAMVE